MGLVLTYEYGQTPLDEDEKEGLLAKYVNTKEELDELEQRNIEEAIRWTIHRRKSFTANEILTEEFIRALHRKMFGNVWAWAGEFRRTNKNLGIDKYLISTSLRALLDDCRFWIANATFSDDEIAIRFKHRIVSIHCFPNGNGRHSRLMADVIIEKALRKDFFSWGSNSTSRETDNRKTYLDAIRKADSGNYDYLMAFARS